MEGSGWYWGMKCFGQRRDHSRRLAAAACSNCIIHDQSKRMQMTLGQTLSHTHSYTSSPLVLIPTRLSFFSFRSEIETQKGKSTHTRKWWDQDLNVGFMISSEMFFPSTCCFYVATNVRKAQQDEREKRKPEENFQQQR